MTRSKLLYISRQYRLVVAVVVSLLRGAKSRRSLFGSVAILGVVDAEIECREPVEGILIPDLCIGLEISNQYR